jgi:hypothetical protein
MSTDHYRPEFRRSYAPYYGYLPSRLRKILDERFRAGAISQVIYSYSTPIAWLDGDVWIVPDVRYSATTSTKHQSQLYRIRNDRYIPADAGMDEYMQVLKGLAEYSRGYGYKLGTYRGVAA